MEQELALQNLFTLLIENGFQLGVRDYEDGLKALRCGYGLNDKEKLLWLCKTLWARTEEEKRFLDILFKEISFLRDEKTEDLINRYEPVALDETESFPPSVYDDSFSHDEFQEKAESAPAFNFILPSRQDSGVGLPRVNVEPTIKEYFILSPRFVVPRRRLDVVWRRFRAVRREGPKVELDLHATIEEKCRHGILDKPVLLPARRNQAKLVLLVDVSASMAPWRDFNKILMESLQNAEFGKIRIFYFDNIPDEDLFEKETLLNPEKINAALSENPNSALLIISDCGAARGFKSRLRFLETKKFLADVQPFWKPVAWLNPMPVKRWKNTTAEMVKKSLNVSMFQLNEEGLIKAVDVLRGKKTA